MKKLLLIPALFLLIHVEAQNISAILAAQVGRNYTQVETGPNGENVFLNIGDSNADGRGTSLGPNTTAGTFYNWNGTSFDQITTTDVSNGGSLGTYNKQFAVNYNARTGNKVYLVQKGSGGSNYYPDGDNNNWYTSGNLYVDARTEARKAMVIAGVTKLKAIFITLGTNDNRANTTLSLVQTGVNSLMARLTTDFPNTTIIINQCGRAEAGSPSVGEESFGARLYAIRGYIIDAAKNNTNAYLLSGPSTGIGFGTGMYNTDLLHYNQTLNNYIGAQIDRILANKDTYSKWATCIISSMFDELSSGRKTAIATFVDAEIANSNFWKYEYFNYFKTTVQENCFVDWSFRGYLFNNTSITFTANTYLSSNGTSNQYGYTYYSGINTTSASATDFINGVYVLSNLTSGGTSATLFGGGTSSTVISVGQNTTPAETWRSNDITISTYTGETAIATGFYASARNSGTKYLYKNSTAVTSASVAGAGGNSTILPVLGAINSTGTISSRISAQYQYMIAAPLTTFNLSAFLTNANALVAGW